MLLTFCYILQVFKCAYPIVGQKLGEKNWKGNILFVIAEKPASSNYMYINHHIKLKRKSVRQS